MAKLVHKNVLSQCEKIQTWLQIKVSSSMNEIGLSGESFQELPECDPWSWQGNIVINYQQGGISMRWYSIIVFWFHEIKCWKKYMTCISANLKKRHVFVIPDKLFPLRICWQSYVSLLSTSSRTEKSACIDDGWAAMDVTKFDLLQKTCRRSIRVPLQQRKWKNVSVEKLACPWGLSELSRSRFLRQ